MELDLSAPPEPPDSVRLADSLPKMAHVAQLLGVDSENCVLINVGKPGDPADAGARAKAERMGMIVHDVRVPPTPPPVAPPVAMAMPTTRPRTVPRSREGRATRRARAPGGSDDPELDPPASAFQRAHRAILHLTALELDELGAIMRIRSAWLRRLRRRRAA